MKTCRKCGGVEFYKNRDCKVCARARGAQYQLDHFERDKEKRAQWQRDNPAIYRVASAKWAANNADHLRNKNAMRYAADPEGERARSKNWFQAHPDAHRLYEQNRSCKKRDAGGKLSRGLGEKLFILQRGMCACGCGQPLGDDYELDHTMPIALGGANTDDNIQLLTPTCNRQKNAKHPVDFMRMRGFLL